MLAQLKLVPFIVELHGAWGEAALEFGKRVGAEWGLHNNMPPKRAVPLFFAKLNFALMSAVADILLINAKIESNSSHKINSKIFRSHLADVYAPPSTPLPTKAMPPV